jgi:2,4-dienoyl-CoA reductase-like NADH-dependent reductase (Old Yellow Enzyme family)
LFFRCSAVDGDPAGWQLEDTVALAHEVKALGVDVLDCSSGGISGPATAGGRRQPGFQVPYASEVRRQTGLKSMAVGLITHPEQAEAILAQGDADLIAIAREALVDPAWALHATTHFGCDPQFETWPEQYGWWLNQRQKTSDFYQPEQAHDG